VSFYGSFYTDDQFCHTRYAKSKVVEKPHGETNRDVASFFVTLRPTGVKKGSHGVNETAPSRTVFSLTNGFVHSFIENT